MSVTAAQAATADFSLAREAVELEGIVAVGYGTQRKRDVTGAIGFDSHGGAGEGPGPDHRAGASGSSRGRAGDAELLRAGWRRIHPHPR